VSDPEGWTWDAVIERLLDRGYTDEEIADEFDRTQDPGPGATRAGETMAWSSLHERRRIMALVTKLRTRVRDDVTAEDVRAERDRRKAAHEPSGYDALAKHFHVDPSTIRRRLGALPPK